MGSAKKSDRKDHPRSKILVVDDDPDFCTILKDALSLEGHEVKTCTEGPEAMKIAGKYKFDIAIVDLKMEGITGHEVLRFFIKERPATTVIMISAYADHFVADVLAREAYAYLPKPVDLENLHTLIRKIEAERGEPPRGKKADKFQILVVDNDNKACEIFHKSSRSLQCEVKMTGDADAAVALAEKIKFDTIFLDSSTLGDSGLTTIKSLSKIRPQSKIVLMITYGHSAQNLVEEALRYGVCSCIYKPLNLKEIKVSLPV